MSVADANMTPLQIAENKKKMKDEKRRKEKKEKKGKEKAEVVHLQEEPPKISIDLVPPGSSVLTNAADGFDYETLGNDEDLEIYVIRAPTEIKPKYLENVEITIPPPSLSSLRIGRMSRKQNTYDIWSIRGDDSEVDTVAGGEEVLGLSCLLPRKKDGKMVSAPRPISRHLVIAAQPVQPTAPSNEETEDLYKSPARYQHPQHLLKHRFLPTGALPVSTDTANVIMDADNQSLSHSIDVPPTKSEGKEQSPKRKRTAEGSPKKTKKAKKTKTDL